MGLLQILGIRETIGHLQNEEIRQMQPDTNPVFCLLYTDAVVFGIYKPSVSSLHRSGLFYFFDNRKGDYKGEDSLYRSV